MQGRKSTDSPGPKESSCHGDHSRVSGDEEMNSQLENESFLNNLKSKQEAKLRQMQEEMEAQKRAKSEAAQKAKEEERKEFLISKNLGAVLDMVDQRLKVKSTLIQNRVKKDSVRNALTGKTADAEYQTEYTKQANSYIKIKYQREMTRQLNDPKYHDCVVRQSLNERKKDQNKRSKFNK